MAYESTSAAPQPLVLTQDEKAFAGLAHALMMSTWWIGPLIIYLSKRESRFVRFHALQALLWQIVYTLLFMGGMFVFMGIVMFTAMTASHPPDTAAQFPVGFFILFPFVWLSALGGAALTLTLGIMFCLKAMRGEWAGYPVIGGWARRMVGF